MVDMKQKERILRAIHNANEGKKQMIKFGHKEFTAHIRNRICISGIKARVRMLDVCGSKVIQVNVPSYEIEFTLEEQKRINEIAVNNDLTLVRGLPIVIDQGTNPKAFNFYL